MSEYSKGTVPSRRRVSQLRELVSPGAGPAAKTSLRVLRSPPAISPSIEYAAGYDHLRGPPSPANRHPPPPPSPRPTQAIVPIHVQTHDPVLRQVTFAYPHLHPDYYPFLYPMQIMSGQDYVDRMKNHDQTHDHQFVPVLRGGHYGPTLSEPLRTGYSTTSTERRQYPPEDPDKPLSSRPARSANQDEDFPEYWGMDPFRPATPAQPDDPSLPRHPNHYWHPRDGGDGSGHIAHIPHFPIEDTQTSPRNRR